MTFDVADVINGRALLEGQPVVAFLVEHNGGRHPLDTQPNKGAIYPSHYFSLASLPIFGTVEERGTVFVEDESQLAVRIALGMTGCSSWEELSARGFNYRAGGVPVFGQPTAPPFHVFGLCLMHQQTYQRLIGSGRTALAQSFSCDGLPDDTRMPTDKDGDLALAKRLIEKCLAQAAASRGLEAPENTLELIDRVRVASLRAGSDLLYKVTDRPRMPLLSALANQNGPLFGPRLVSAIVKNCFVDFDMLNSRTGLFAVGHKPDFEAALSALWDCVHLNNRMYDIHASFMPSIYAGSDRNFGAVLEQARTTMRDVWEEAVRECVECYGAGNLPKDLEDELAKAEVAVAEMRNILAHAQSPAA